MMDSSFFEHSDGFDSMPLAFYFILLVIFVETNTICYEWTKIPG